MANTSHYLTKRAKEQNTTVLEMVKSALEQTDTIEAAAGVLGISHPTLLYHMKRMKISVYTPMCPRVVVEQKSAS